MNCPAPSENSSSTKGEPLFAAPFDSSHVDGSGAGAEVGLSVKREVSVDVLDSLWQQTHHCHCGLICGEAKGPCLPWLRFGGGGMYGLPAWNHG